MNRLRTKGNKRLGVGFALAGLVCQLVLSLLHVPGAMAAQSVSETGKLVTIICTPTGVKRVVIDIDGSGIPADIPEDGEDLTANCPVCLSLGGVALAVLPDVVNMATPVILPRKFGHQFESANLHGLRFRASQRAPPLQA